MGEGGGCITPRVQFYPPVLKVRGRGGKGGREEGKEGEGRERRDERKGREKHAACLIINYLIIK